MNDYLKIKVVSLGDEVKRIRKQEAFRVKRYLRFAPSGVEPNPDKFNFHYNIYQGLLDHRKRIVSTEARAANLAYGFNRGHSYEAIEANPHTYPNLKKVRGLAARYGNEPYDLRSKRYELWERAAEEHLARLGVYNPAGFKKQVTQAVSEFAA